MSPSVMLGKPNLIWHPSSRVTRRNHTVNTSIGLSSRLRTGLAFVLSLLFLVAGLAASTPAQAAADDRPVSGASFIWGINGYAQKGIFGPWLITELTGNASLLTGSVSGGSQSEYTPGGYPETSMPASTPQETPNAVKFTAGTGTVNPRTGEATLSWTGGYQVNAYPDGFGAPDELYSDPVLTVDADGTGTLSMHFVLGAGVDMSGDPTEAVDLGRVTLVTLSDVSVTGTGFTAIPDYQGTLLDSAQLEGGVQDTTCSDVWGAWAPDFVYAIPGSVRPHFYSTGCGGMQLLKPALPIEVAYTTTSLTPEVVVSKTTGLNQLGDTVTVTGSGFLPNPPETDATRAPLGAGNFGGVYVAFGKFLDVWQLSADAPAKARKAGDNKWAVPADKVETVGGVARGAIVLGEDGTFSTELVIDKSVVDVEDVAAGNYGIYTYPGGGSTYAGFETFTPISFAPLATALTFTASPAAQVTEGGLVTLRVALESPVPGTVSFKDGATVLGTVTADPVTGVAELVVPSLPVGSHTIVATFTPDDPVEFATSTASLAYTVNAKIVAAGSLTWGFKESFRSYVVGSIAKGSISTTGVGGSGGAFVFGQATGGTFNGSTGTSNYSGSVRFLGHGGILDLTLANPVVRIDSSQSAMLLMDVNGSRRVPFASLNLGAASRSAAGGAVSYSGVPAALTAQGASAFTYEGERFYPSGTVLDPLSFVIGSASAAGGGTRTVAAFVAPPELPSTPPATTGLTLDPDSLESLSEGGEVTITGEGFEPGETGIKVVVYSEPVLLDENATADASGVVTWTGKLPMGLVGKHTLTLQGSVARGIVLDIPATITMTAVEGCPVTDASLLWGFKESFRSYISGSIANGEWTTADGATYSTPNFSWADGTGAFDPEATEGLLGFAGSIEFTGHGGILDTTVSNPQLRFDGPDTATLLLDVSGTTQDGEEVSETGVEFATVDLGAATRTVDGSAISFDDAPAVLLAAGSRAFGTYEAGEELDPISVTVVTGADCGAKAVEDSSNEPVLASGSDLGWLGWTLGGILLLIVLVLLATMLARRARRS